VWTVNVWAWFRTVVQQLTRLQLTSESVQCVHDHLSVRELTPMSTLVFVEEFLLRLRCSPLYINMDFGFESMGGNGVLKMSA